MHLAKDEPSMEKTNLLLLFCNVLECCKGIISLGLRVLVRSGTTFAPVAKLIPLKDCKQAMEMTAISWCLSLSFVNQMILTLTMQVCSGEGHRTVVRLDDATHNGSFFLVTMVAFFQKGFMSHSIAENKYSLCWGPSVTHFS